ncbi:MAG TPA: M14 family metallocarboxypeptidase [Nitrospiria bacterium]|nr:M14 family metallocarboxypeptidase [Nitrospiria bacterium]
MTRPAPQPRRSYRSILQRLHRAVRAVPGGRLEPIGEAVHGARRYPLVAVMLTTGPAARRRRRGPRPLRVCLGAGIHGDEPAGVEAVLKWLTRLPATGASLPPAELVIFPCLNPSGYERNRRVNDDGIDLNRQYRNQRAPVEVRAVRSLLARLSGRRAGGRAVRRFDLSVEFHEDVDSTGFYLYELIGRRAPVGLDLTAAAARRLPVNHASKIEGAGAESGVIHRDRRAVRRRRTRWPHALYLFHLGTPRCLTFETPVTIPLARRAAVHAELFTLALRLEARGHRQPKSEAFGEFNR